MKLESVEIENYRAIEHLRLPLDPALTVLHGGNTCGKTSVLGAIAVGLGVIPDLLPGVSGIDFLETDLRAGQSFVHVFLETDLRAGQGKLSCSCRFDGCRGALLEARALCR